MKSKYFTYTIKQRIFVEVKNDDVAKYLEEHKDEITPYKEAGAFWSGGWYRCKASKEIEIIDVVENKKRPKELNL